jgi:hypothetical protein
MEPPQEQYAERTGKFRSLREELSEVEGRLAPTVVAQAR